jgi:hypothetical protein
MKGSQCKGYAAALRFIGANMASGTDAFCLKLLIPWNGIIEYMRRFAQRAGILDYRFRKSSRTNAQI